MTDEEIIELAWQYGDIVTSKGGGGVWEIPNIVGFARAIEQRTLNNQKARWYQIGVEAEREACAEICKSMRPSKQEFDQRFYTACTLCADAIRARGE